MADPILTPEEVTYLKAEYAKAQAVACAAAMDKKVNAGTASSKALLIKYRADVVAGDKNATVPTWNDLCKAFEKAGA